MVIIPPILARPVSEWVGGIEKLSFVLWQSKRKRRLDIGKLLFKLLILISLSEG